MGGGGAAGFRHQVYAPGFCAGYGVTTIPGVREGIEKEEWKAACPLRAPSEALAGLTERVREAERIVAGLYLSGVVRASRRFAVDGKGWGLGDRRQEDGQRANIDCGQEDA